MNQPIHPERSSDSLSIRAEVQDVRVASAWLGQFGSNHSVPDEQINRLDLCLNEALANVLSYGDEQAHLFPIGLTASVERHGGQAKASVTVSDAGPEFDVAGAPLTDRPQTLADAQPGGLGILMIRSFSDDLVYKRQDNRNELTFSVRWELRTT